MATTTTAVRSSSNAPSMARPIPPSTSADTGQSSSSPTLNSKPTPTSNAKPLNISNNVNGTLSRTRPKQRPSQVKIHERNNVNGESMGARPREPYVKDSNYILRKFRGKPPSLILHLHPTYFRFDQQDGTFSYNSEMRIIIEHLKARTVPHDLIEELLQTNVTFYDGCLIVEVHDHKTAAAGNKDVPSNSGDLRGSKLFTLHDNSNRFITPSPYAPYPTDREPASRPTSSKENINVVSGNMPAPDKPAKKANKPRIFTVVLHPTDLARHREIGYLTRLPVVDQKGSRRQASLSSRERPTPLSAIPPTPTSASATASYVSKGAKRQRMFLEEADIHQFEGELLKTHYPSLLLEPARDFADSQAMMNELRDPLHDQKPVQKQSRKRTTAELAADEAAAAEEERIALIMDDRLPPSLSSGDGKAPDFQPDFARFKKFEDIKRNHEQEKQRKSEEDVLANQQRAQQRSEEDKRRQAQETAARQEQQLRQQRALEASKMAQQRQTQAQMQQQHTAVQSQSPMHNAMMQQMMQQSQQAATQGPHMSPAVGQHAPSNASPLAGGNMFTTSMAGPAMAPTSSTQGPGSPPRPGSAMQAPQGMAPPMARQVSQQTSQANLSRNSTPQLPHATPQMRNMTPQPPQNHIPNGIQQTPVVGQQQPPPPPPPQQQPIRAPQQINAQQMSNLQQLPPQLQQQFIAARSSGNQQQQAQVHALIQQYNMTRRQNEMLRQQQQSQMGQRPAQAPGQGSPQSAHVGAQMSPQANGTPHGQVQNQGQLPPQMQQQGQQNNMNDQMAVQQRMQDYRRSLAAAAQKQMTNGQSSPHSPPQQSMPQQYPNNMSSAGSPNGISMAPTMNRTASQFPGNAGQAQSPHGQQHGNQIGPGNPQQPRPPNGQPTQLTPQQVRAQYFHRLAQSNQGQLPPDAEQRWQQWFRARQQQLAQQAAQQTARQHGGGVMMPGQGLQAMQQAAMRPPSQANNMQGLDAYQQQQQQAALLKAQQQRQIAMRQQQQNQQQQSMMNGMGPNMMGSMGGMNNGMGRQG